MKEVVWLVLLLDASGSITYDQWNMQVDGYRAAMENPHIIALTEEFDVQFAMIQFAEEAHVITDFTDREGVLAALEGDILPETTNDHTCINKPLILAREMLVSKPGRRVIDLATDGLHTVDGCPPPLPQALGYTFFDDNITINGLQLPFGSSSGEPVYQSLLDIATGFIVRTEMWNDVIDATTRKLYTEISLAPWPEEREAVRPASYTATARAKLDLRPMLEAPSASVDD